MFQVTISFRFKQQPDEDAVDRIWALAAAYFRSGQLVDQQWVTVRSPTRTVRIVGVAHERCALTPHYGSKETRSVLAELRTLLQGPPKTEWDRFGEDARACCCASPSRLDFSPDVVHGGSPLRCMDCRGRRPIYRLRPAARSMDLRGLARQWAGLYWMWMESGVMEEWAWRSLADPESEFVRDARKTVGNFEKRAEVPVYYDLLTHYRSPLREPPESEICPSCGRPWKREPSDRLSCRSCRIASYSPVDSEPPHWWRPLRLHRPRARPGRRL